MTRDEAIQVVKEQGEGMVNRPGHLVDILEGLGLLKLEEPKTATDRALAALNRQHIIGGGMLSSKTLCEIMDQAGVRIVDKT